MNLLLRLSRAIDALNERVGHLVYWLVLAAVVVSAGNASMRYVFDMSSNAWLELQWYLFAAVFLLAAGYTFLHNEHVRIDVVYGHLPPKVRAAIDLLGGLLFLLPMMASNILQALFGTINNIYLGQMIGVDALAAVTVFFPVMFAPGGRV